MEFHNLCNSKTKTEVASSEVGSPPNAFAYTFCIERVERIAHLPQDAGYLEKPFLPIELARKVRALLNESDREEVVPARPHKELGS
jgi:DNA-binding response OmpR family regulator